MLLTALPFYSQHLNLTQVFETFGNRVVMHIQRFCELPCADIHPATGIYFGDRV